MPAENVQFKPRSEILTFEEIARFVRVTAAMGISKLRLTGGEPLVRHHLADLVRMLAGIEGIREIGLTTNGILLAEQAGSLKEAGLHRLNVSLDTLREETFQKVSRRDGLQRVLDGIFAAREAGFNRIRLNAIAIRNLTEDEVIPLAGFARDHGFELRFIEYMPLDADNQWDAQQVLSGRELRAIIERAFGPTRPISSSDPSQPATDYEYADGGGRIGFINPVTQSFCDRCNRLRLTAEGKIRNCLFSIEEWDARSILRGGGSDDDLVDLVRRSVAAKKAGHGIDSEEFVKPPRAMYQIGG